MIGRILLGVFLIGISGSSLCAQDVRVSYETQQPPYYVGQPAVIQFTVEGLDEQPQPTCSLESPSGQAVPGLRGQMGAANASVISRIVQRDGRLLRSNRITYRINYLVTADRPGTYEVGPFVITQGNKEARVKALTMSFLDVPLDADMRIRLVLPEGPIYPDQRVPVAIEWWYAGEMDNVLRLSIYSPLFDQFRFAQEQASSRKSAQLPINTRDGSLAIPATTRNEQQDGREFLVVSASRTLIPDRVGEFQLEPITATISKATAWERSRSPFGDLDDLGFGGSLFRDLMDQGRRPARTVLGRASGEPLTLVVSPFPAANRPESFSGAVGSGFSLDVAADRTVVRVGDPIGLDLTLRGDGNIANARLPSLSAHGGMSPELFRLPTGDVPGTLTDGAKRFRVSVRVADESVTEIPALAYSWFDPTSHSYQTARSKPIALRVMPAQVVSANDVISSQAPRSPMGGDPSDDRESKMFDASRPVFSFSGADLAIEPDAKLILRNSSRSSSKVVMAQIALYAAGLVFVLVALVDRRRRNADPELVAQRKRVRQQNARIVRAASLPSDKAAEEIAAALRVLIAEGSGVSRDEAQAVIAECESIAYAPEISPDRMLDESLIERAKRVAES